jgi:hypothetical protein
VKTCILAVIIAVALPSAVPPALTETTLGAGVSLKDATPLSVLLEQPKTFVGKRIRVDGVATSVCTKMGCWMAVAAADDPKGATVRLKVDHDSGIVFPVTAKGRAVSAEGIFEALGANDHEAKEAAGEHGKQDANASVQYQIKATGAVIR